MAHRIGASPLNSGRFRVDVCHITHEPFHSAVRTDPLRRPADAGPTWHEVARARRKPKPLLGFRGRLLVYYMLVVFGSLGATAWLVTEHAIVAGRKALADSARSISVALADASANALAAGDLATIQRLASHAAIGEPVVGVSVTDAFGKPVVTAASEPRHAELDGAGTSRGMRGSSPVVARRGEQTTTIGHAEITLSDASLTRDREVTLRSFALVAAGLCVCGLLLSWLSLRCAVRPVKRLLASARRVTAGDLDTAVDADDGDLAGDLAVEFNTLVLCVQDRQAQIEAANRAAAMAIAELERKIEDRSAQLGAANDRLSGEIAEKEDFLRAVSHDLNAPLRNIGGMVSMLMLKNKDHLPPDVVGRLERIQKNVEVETDLINELLELSRIKTRRQTLDVVDTESLVWDLRGVFENDLKTRHIDLVLETSLPSLYAERARLRQVFQNLIDNAIKYMGDGPVREIRVGCRVSVTEAEFYVRDTGLGIHPDDLDKVFFVFRRGRGEAASKVPGKGVGLSSVKSIVETYAGRIWVQSALGEGTTFRFTINGKYVPAVAGVVPSELTAQTGATGPTLAATSLASGNQAA